MGAKKRRYPGINFFTESDRDIFKGREKDVERLYTEIMLSDTMVLHAESGVGKSSLVRAGLVPYIKEKNKSFTPVIINFGRTNKLEDKGLLLNILISTIKNAIGNLKKSGITLYQS